MTLTRPWAIDTAFPNAIDQRQQLGEIYPYEGVFPSPITTAAAGVAYAGAGWAISARAFVAAIKRSGAPFSQTYGTALVGNNGVVASAWTVGVAPGVGSRIDRLCIRARDTTQGDSATGAPTDGPGGVARTGFPEFLVVAGTSGTPGVAPALPSGYFEVAQVTVSAGNASASAATISQTYSFATPVGATMIFRTTAALLAYTTAANLFPGQRAIALDAVGEEWLWTGAAWEGGWVTYTPTWSGSAGTPVLGNGILVGRYRKRGKTVEFQGSLSLGTTTNGAGAGDFRFALPFPASASGIRTPILFYMERAGIALYPGVGRVDPSATRVEAIVYGAGSGIAWGSSGDNFAIGSRIDWQGRYESA